MTAQAVRSVLADLPAIGLDELTERASLQTRVDRKYVVPLEQAEDLLTGIAADAWVLEIDGLRSFTYESLYFDTTDLVSYLLSAHRRRRRFKVRTRTYLDSAECWLEIKTCGSRGATVKDRLPYEQQHRASLVAGRGFVDTVLARERVRAGAELAFVPTLLTRYRRRTLFLPATNSRVTIDTELLWDDGHHLLQLPALAVIETKSSSAASGVDRMLWDRGHRPNRISKYATGLAALRPELPATPWRRTLRRHFLPAEPATASPTSYWQPAGRPDDRI